MKLVLIEWLDSDLWTTWTREDPAVGPINCKSVGWLLHDGDRSKTIAGHTTIEKDPQRAGMMVIPSCCIVKIVEIQVPGE